MIPKRSKYAIKALTALAKVYREKQHLSIATIAEQEHIPRKFLEAILLQLRNEGLVNSKMGANGGYFLVKHPDEIMLSTIIRSTGGPIALIPCVSLNFYEVLEASIHILSKTSLADLILREKKLFRKMENTRK
jgi:Rrf2 family protein